ncbi:MAG: alpha/beta hydrolase [Actinomycetota bacterium]|nr:alpha/beta hydrolase [Actinomycetota bacterium]
MRSAELEQVVDLLFAQRKSSDPTKRTAQELRDRLDGLARVFPLPDDVARSELDLGGVPAVRLEPPGAGEDILLYLHGGGYGGGSALSHSELAARLGRAAGVTAVLPEYRLAPEDPFPAALDDALAFYRAMLAELNGDATRIVVGGDSAGGGLAVAMCVALRDAGEPLPRTLALLSPWLDLTCSSPSWDARFEGDPVLDHSLREAAERYLAGTDPRDPLASPLFADLSDLPSVLLQVGTHEILYDDAVSFADQATRAGVEVELEIGHDLIHVWPIFPITPEAVASTARIGRHLSRLSPQ